MNELQEAPLNPCCRFCGKELELEKTSSIYFPIIRIVKIGEIFSCNDDNYEIAFDIYNGNEILEYFYMDNFLLKHYVSFGYVLLYTHLNKKMHSFKHYVFESNHYNHLSLQEAHKKIITYKKTQILK